MKSASRVVDAVRMQRADFLRAYPARISPSMTPELLGGDLPEWAADLQRAERFAARWGDILYDFLAHDQSPPLAEYQQLLDEEYAPWANRTYGLLFAMIEAVRDTIETWQHDAGGDRDVIPNELALRMRGAAEVLHLTRFHLLQRFSQTSWMPVLYAADFGAVRPAVAETWALRARVGFGRQAVDLALLREAIAPLDAAGSHEARELRRAVNGVLAELDGGVFCAECVRRFPEDGVVALPAPTQFEQAAGDANADFIVVDTESGALLGIDVKSTSRGKNGPVSDRARLWRLNAAEDLNGYRRVDENGRASTTGVPLPGTFALRYLSTAHYDPAVSSHLSRAQFELYKRHATELLPASLPDAARRMNALADAAERARHDPDARPHGPVPVKESRRRFKQHERAKFDDTVTRVYGRMLARLRSGDEPAPEDGTFTPPR